MIYYAFSITLMTNLQMNRTYSINNNWIILIFEVPGKVKVEFNRINLNYLYAYHFMIYQLYLSSQYRECIYQMIFAVRFMK